MPGEVRVKNAKYQLCLRHGVLDLQSLSSGEGDADCSVRLPPAEGITCAQLTAEFLIYGTESGSLVYHYLDDLSGPCLVNEYSHSNGGITRLWPNSAGTRLIFEDDRGLIYLHNPLNDEEILVPVHAGELDAALWDSVDSLIFVLLEHGQIFVYIYSPVSVHNPIVSFIQASTLPAGLTPVALQNGILTCKGMKQDGGGLQTVTLPTHTLLKKPTHSAKKLRERFDQALGLLHFKEALEDAKLLKCPEVWGNLTTTALEHMEIEVAIEACHHSGNIKLLMSLQQVKHVEEHHMLSAHIFLLLGNFGTAQELFLKSSCPEAAVDMRRDIEDWDQAMILAKKLLSTPDPEILGEYARALESSGDYRKALLHYEDFLETSLHDTNHKKYFFQAGVARTSFHLGDIWKGKHMAKECNNSQLYKECVQILEGLSLLEDAAEVYELDGQLEKAIEIHITTKNHAKALSLLKTIESPKLYALYARALEVERKFAEAAMAYEEAEEYEHAVRVYLGPLKNPSEAFAIVRKNKTVEGASIASKYCKSVGDYENAIEFLIMQKKIKEARELAEQQDKMDVYTERVADVASKGECLKLARYYETMGNSQKAASMFDRCGEPKQALRIYLAWGIVTAIEQAIDMVGRVRDDVLTNQLLEFLAGDMEGADKSPLYLFRLHMVLGNYDLATKAALLIAQQEQETGNYKIAHRQLFELSTVLEAQHKRVPFELSKQLILLHSYTLVKTLIRLGDHRSSARMLIRVARHISKFPAHVIPILISTVIECHRSGLKKTAFDYASMLMRPEFRSQITGIYKRKIENIVRKPERTEEDEELSPCPFCQELVPETQLECPTCRNYLPFCIASGRHMVLGNWTKCPSCQFPALLTEFSKIIDVEKVCPMCWNEIAVDAIVEIADPIEDMKLKNSLSEA